MTLYPYDSCSEKDGSTEEARGLGGIFQAFNAFFCFLTLEAQLYLHRLNHYHILLAMSRGNSFVQLPVLGLRLH